MAGAKKLPQFLAAICVCIGAMGTGTVIAWTSNISEELQNGDLNDLELDLYWAGSMMCLGAFFVCIPIGYLADIIGRKLTCLITVIPFTIGWLLIIFTQHLAMLLVGRFLTGMAGGSFCIVAPLYTSEIAQDNIRGTLGTFLQLFITIGILFSNLLGWLISIKIFSILCAVVPLVFGICFLFQPETPVYLIKIEKKDKAMAAYSRLRGKEYDPSAEIKIIETELAKEKELQGQFMKTLKSKQGTKSSIICFALMFYQQLSGINAVMFYSGAIFEAAGGDNSKLYATIIGIVQVVATVFASWLVEKLGRKILLILSTLIMSISTILLGVFFLLKDQNMVEDDTIKTISFIPIVSLVLFIIAFSIGMGPIPWLASSEIFPPAIKAKMSSYAGAFNWLLAFVVTIGYGPLSDLVGSYTTFFIFGVVSATGVAFVWLVVPETKGKSFQEIQDILGS